MTTIATANKMLRKPANVRDVIYKDVKSTKGIIDVILQVDNQYYKQAAKFSQQFSPVTKRSLKKLWAFVRNNIRYVPDRVGREEVKTPEYTWAHRQTKGADCKSMSVFIGSILKNLNIEYDYRFAGYNPRTKEISHVYVVAYLDGEEIILDAVHTVFNEEVDFSTAYDYDPDTKKRFKIAGMKKSSNIFVALFTGFLIYKIVT